MVGHLSAGIGKKHSALLAAFAGLAGAGVLSSLLTVVSRWRTFVVWCREFFIANLGGYGPAGLAAVTLAAALCVAAVVAVTWSVVHEAMRSYRLGRMLASRGSFASARVQAAAAEKGLDRVHIVDDPEAYAFTRGLLRPRVYLSRGLVSALTRNELRAVIAHEAFHAHHRHPLQSTVAGLLERALFFVPTFKDVLGHLAVVREVRADDAAGDRRAIASALARLAAPSSRAHGLYGVAHFSRIRERIRVLAAADGTVELRLGVLRLVLSAAAVLLIVLAASVATDTANAQGTAAERGFSCPAPDEIMSRCIDLSPFLKLNVEGPMSRAIQSPYVVSDVQ